MRKKFWGRLLMTMGCMAILAVTKPAAVMADEDTVFVKSELPDPVFSCEAGFYDQAELELTLTAEGNYKIYYTTDGTLPVVGSSKTKEYTEPIVLKDVRSKSSKVTAGTAVRAMTVSASGVCGDVITKTFFVGEGIQNIYKDRVEVVSLVTDPSNLYDKETGIFVKFRESGKEWERPFHVEYFEKEGSLVMDINCGGRVHGGQSREFDVKSIRLYAREEYDTQKNFKYDFFSDGTVVAQDVNGNNIKKFKHLLIRGAGNEATSWDRTYFRDALTHWAMQDTGLDVQACQPVVVFLNGKYYGVMNLRERQDAKYVENHYGLDDKQVVVYSFWYDEEGKQNYEADADTSSLANDARNYYSDFMRFIRESDLNTEENFAKLNEYLDIDNYIDYLSVELFCDNRDWPGNNTKIWRYVGENDGKVGADGKLRFFLYDTEFGYGLYNRDVSDDSLGAMFDENSKEWPNQWGSTEMFRYMMKCDKFYATFVSRMLDLMNGNLETDRLLTQVNAMAMRYAFLVPENKASGTWYGNYDDNIFTVRNFIRRRAKIMYALMERHLEMGTKYSVKIDFDQKVGGLQVNTLTVGKGSAGVDGNGFNGIYYNNYPVTVTALANAGVPVKGFEIVGVSKAEDILTDVDASKVEATSDGVFVATDTIVIADSAKSDSVYIKAVYADAETAPVATPAPTEAPEKNDENTVEPTKAPEPTESEEKAENTPAAETTEAPVASENAETSGSSAEVVVAIVAGAVLVIGAVAAVIMKRKKKDSASK